MIKAFDKQNLQQLRADMDAAIQQVAQKHGITIRLKNISYLPERATSKLEFIATGEAASAANPQAAQEAIYAADFKRYCSSFGLKPEQHGATFKHGRDTYKLVGLKPRAPKNPILAKSFTNGRIYILPESAIAPLQSKEHRSLFGTLMAKTPGENGMCSNDNSYDESFKPIGKCNRPATTFRKSGFGKTARTATYCDQCARLIDESRAEMEAEARCS